MHPKVNHGQGLTHWRGVGIGAFALGWWAVQVNSQAEFEDVISASEELVVCDLFAAWCGPCLPLRLLVADFPLVRFVAVNVSVVTVLDPAGEPFPETAEPTFALILVRVVW
jgi:hypothetical protein